MRKPLMLSAAALLLAVAPAAAQVTQHTIANSASQSIAVAGSGRGGGGPVLNTPDAVAPSILTQSVECPADGWAAGVSVPGGSGTLGSAHVDQRMRNPCQTRQYVHSMMTTAVTERNLGNAQYARDYEWWSKSVMCAQPDLRRVAPPGVCDAAPEQGGVAAGPGGSTAPVPDRHGWFPIAGGWERVDEQGKMHFAAQALIGGKPMWFYRDDP
jgi:hypothetical protein